MNFPGENGSRHAVCAHRGLTALAKGLVVIFQICSRDQGLSWTSWENIYHAVCKTVFFSKHMEGSSCCFLSCVTMRVFDRSVLKSRLLLPILLVVGIFLLLYFGKISD